MISIDWQQVIGAVILAASALGGIAYAGRAAWTKFRTAKPATPADSSERSADEPAPPGAVEWVADICDAMGNAPDSTKLGALLAGSTRDHARALRISELEAKP